LDLVSLLELVNVALNVFIQQSLIVAIVELRLFDALGHVNFVSRLVYDVVFVKSRREELLFSAAGGRVSASSAAYLLVLV